jgi:hypothetical protein
MSRSLLLQSILGHMALLAEQYPEKAASPVAKRARRYVKLSLHGAGPSGAGGRGAAAAPTVLGTAAAARPLRRAA